MPYVAQAKQVSNLVEVRPELSRGMRNHLLALYVLLAIKPTVGAEVLAVLRAHDRDGIVSVFLRGRQLQFEFAVNVAAMCELVVGPIQFFIIVRSLQPIHSIPKVLGLPHPALGKCLKLSRFPRLNLALRRMGWSVIGVSVDPGLSGRIDLREEDANVNRQIGICARVLDKFIEGCVPLAAVYKLGAGTNQRAVLEVDLGHGFLQNYE